MGVLRPSRKLNRDGSEDQVLRDVISAGSRLKAIFKEPTITPTADQVKRLGLKKPWGSPNGAMRRGWNGITISRDTIHIDGVELGYKNPVFFERHAVGGGRAEGYKIVGSGKLLTTFVPEGAEPVVVDDRQIVDRPQRRRHLPQSRSITCPPHDHLLRAVPRGNRTVRRDEEDGVQVAGALLADA